LGENVKRTASAAMPTLLAIILLVFAFDIQPVSTGMSPRVYTVVRVIPEIVELGPENVTGKAFTIAVVVEDVTDLIGYDMLFTWNITYLQYLHHTRTSTVEDYPYIIPPSYYAGIIHDPPFRHPDNINGSTGRYWPDFATLGGPGFYGSGTVFVMTFKVINQPSLWEEDFTTTLHISRVNLWSYEGSIPHEVFDGTVVIHARLKGDLNGDGVVDIYDIVLAAEAYGSKLGDSNWNPDADLAPLWGKIDIFDLVTLVYHFTKTSS